MFAIDKARLESESRSPDAKIRTVTSNVTVFDQTKLAIVNLVEKITGLHIYDAAHWASNIDRWIQNASVENTTYYKRGEIVFLDLGSQNFGYEPSYTHACIVLANRCTSILVVPCSSKKYNSGHREIISATTANGFSRNTGIQSESFRWVSKNRVVSSTHKRVTSDILDKLDSVLLSLAPSVEKELDQLKTDNKDLLEQKETLDQELRELKNTNEDLQKEIDDLREKLKANMTENIVNSVDNQDS